MTNSGKNQISNNYCHRCRISSKDKMSFAEVRFFNGILYHQNRSKDHVMSSKRFSAELRTTKNQAEKRDQLFVYDLVPTDTPWNEPI